MSHRFPLGFRQKPSDKDKRYPLALRMKAVDSMPVSKVWKPGPVTNQLETNACFPPTTLVRMSDGSERRIDEVRLLDEVLTAEGNIGRVTHLFVNQNADALVKLSLWGHNHLMATPEHPILTKKGYTPIKDLNLDDWVAMPRFMPCLTGNIVTSNHVPKYRMGVRQERMIRYAGVVGRSSACATRTPIPETIPLNGATGRIFGLFLAEGNTSSSQVVWTFSYKEKDTLAKELAELLRDELHVKPYLKESQKYSRCTVRIDGRPWAILFESLCSTGSGKKRLHPDLTSAPKEFQDAMFQGWMDGDGYERRTTKQGVTVSKRLAMSMFDIAQSLGKRPSIRYSEPKISHGVKSRLPRWDLEMGQSGEDSYRCEQTETHVWRKVRGISLHDHEGPVYNMEVEGDNSYVAEGIGVHNCVGHSCFKLLTSEPVVLSPPSLDPFQIYDEARKNDEWDDNDFVDSGTSIRAGLEVLRRHGLIGNYFWSNDHREAVEFLLSTGPLVIGVNWRSGMFDPDSFGVIRPTGSIEGGHAVFVYAADWINRFITIRNSWSEDWGISGDCLLGFNDFDRLLKEDGAACAAVSEPVLA